MASTSLSHPTVKKPIDMATTTRPQADNKGPELLEISWTFCSMAILVTALRVVARFRTNHSIGWDDLFIIIATVSSVNDNIALQARE